MRKSNMKIASMVTRQILDNTMITAGLTTDTKGYVNRVNNLLLHVLDSHKSKYIIN
jgi:hypothetical protein